MPTYCYKQDDRTYEWDSPMSRIPQALLVNGRIAERDIVAEHGGQRSGDPWENHESLALMVHPLDVKAYQEDARDKGLTGVTVRKDGMFEFRSMEAKRRYCSAYGFVDKQSYY